MILRILITCKVLLFFLQKLLGKLCIYSLRLVIYGWGVFHIQWNEYIRATSCVDKLA